MRLRPYQRDVDFEVIRTWDNDERTHAMWSANLIGYPLQKDSFEQKLKEIRLKFGDKPYVAVTDDGSVVGFFCFSVNPASNEGMLKFVIVDPNLRGQGYGKEMLSLAVKNAFENTNASAVALAVFEENKRAKNCYLSVGFRERSLTENASPFGEEKWGRCNMAIDRPEQA